MLGGVGKEGTAICSWKQKLGLFTETQTTEIVLQEMNQKPDEIWRTVILYSLNVYTYTHVSIQRNSPYFTKIHTYSCLACSRQENDGQTHIT